MCSLFDINLDEIEGYAHSKSDGNKENFSTHCHRTLKYYQKITELYEIENIYSKLLSNIDMEKSIDINRLIGLFKKISILHDIGKLTSSFQRKLDGAKNNTTHSDKSFGVIIYFLLKLKKNEKINSKEFLILFLVTYSVFKHHGKLNNILEDLGDFNFSQRLVETKEILLLIGENIDYKIIDVLCSTDFWKQWNRKKIRDLLKIFSTKNLSFFILLKLFHSILISSDYWATMEYETGEEFDFFIIDESLKKSISNNFHNNRMMDNKGEIINFNPGINERKKSLRNMDIEEIYFKDNNEKADALNSMRSHLNIITEDELGKTLDTQPDKRVFFLNIPTGGGKTNISMRLGIKIMEKREIKKLFYVFPFINLIEQSFDRLKYFIGENNLTRLDSRYIAEDTENENSNNDIYSRYVDNLFFNKPVLFLSHVKFFDMIFRNNKNSNYNFHQLSNSIVIIDEIQAYRDSIWTETANTLEALGKYLNTYFIVMSATLPEINKLLGQKNDVFYSLIKKSIQNKIFKHKVFDRVEIKPDKNFSIRKDKKLEKEKIIKKLKTFKDFKKILIVVNKVIDSLEIYNLIYSRKEFKEYNVLLLNSTISDGRRKDIIINCKKKDEKIILISTQSVEAGVDIDFDIGIRAYAPLDSLVQVAGRINRNNYKDKCELYVFKDESVHLVYKGDTKSKLTTEKDFETAFFSKNILDYNKIEDFYSKIIEQLKKNNNTRWIVNSEGNISDMANLFFKKINREIHLIEGDTLSLFIPFDNDGQKIWQDYKALFDDRKSFQNFIKIKEFRKKLIPYSVNIFNSYTKYGKLKDILKDEIKYGYYYCDNWEKYYSIEQGLNTKMFKEVIGSREFLFM